MPPREEETLRRQMQVTTAAPVEVPQLPAQEGVARIAIVPGNQPLGAATPTVALMNRTLRAVAFFRENPDTILVFSGGATTGGICEARMMAVIAQARGVPAEACLLEERAWTTRDNAAYTAQLLRNRNPDELIIISTPAHLEVALPLFRAEFSAVSPERIRGLAVETDPAAVLRQMAEYDARYHDPVVSGRAAVLRLGGTGVD